MASAKVSAKPDQVALADGVYGCASCTPPYSVPADGRPHSVAGHDN